MSLEVPELPDSYAITLLNEALNFIEDSQIWSFQLKESGWLTPGLLFPGGPGTSVGTVTTKSFTSTIVGDAAASAVWAAYQAGGSQPFFTQCQIRSPFYSLYNIIGYETTSHAPFGTFTLDRPWMEPGGVGQTYMIYQAYFPVPVPDFKRFLSARDTTNNAPMNYWGKTQKDLSVEDPERTIFDDPAYFVPYQTDQRPGSSTLGYMLYELWPHPLSVLPYTYAYMRRGPTLTQPTDTVPYPLSEEMVLWRAKEAAYLYKEAQKGSDIERGAGADFKFLSEAAHAEYELRLDKVSKSDRDMVDLFISKYRLDEAETTEPFSTITGQLNVGKW